MTSELKIDAARALALFKEDAAPALPLLLKVLKQDKDPSRAAVIDVLREIGPEARAAVPVLIEFVLGKDAVLARGAIGALGSIGRDAKEAVPAITEATKSKDPLTAVRHEVFRPLGQHRGPQRLHSSPVG